MFVIARRMLLTTQQSAAQPRLHCSPRVLDRCKHSAFGFYSRKKINKKFIQLNKYEVVRWFKGPEIPPLFRYMIIFAWVVVLCSKTCKSLWVCECVCYWQPHTDLFYLILTQTKKKLFINKNAASLLLIQDGVIS